jgi:hypothetical protein
MKFFRAGMRVHAWAESLKSCLTCTFTDGCPCRLLTLDVFPASPPSLHLGAVALPSDVHKRFLGGHLGRLDVHVVSLDSAGMRRLHTYGRSGRGYLYYCLPCVLNEAPCNARW